MNLDDGRVHGYGLDFNADQLFALQFLKNGIQHLALRLAVHAGVNGVPVAKEYGQAARFAALLGDKQNRVQHGEVRQAYVAPLAGQDWLNATVLLLGDLHRPLAWQLLCFSVNRS